MALDWWAQDELTVPWVSVSDVCSYWGHSGDSGPGFRGDAAATHSHGFSASSGSWFFFFFLLPSVVFHRSQGKKI